MMGHAIVELIRRHARPLKPIPTGMEPSLKRLPDVQAVLFDIYGTLFISASGDIGLVQPERLGEVFVESLRAAGIEFRGVGQEGVDCLVECIREEHEHLGASGVEWPEVDIAEIWKKVLNRLASARKICGSPQRCDYRHLAIQYEMRTNPVWPMPDCGRVLAGLRDAGVLLGLISNAQFFTPYLFPALLGQSRTEWGFRPELTLFSFEHRRAKPGTELFERARETLRQRWAVPAEAVLYVGNDMKNDVAPAARVGFRTALFAGDRRSLRMREDDPSVDGVQPDVVLTTLCQLFECVPLTAGEGPTADTGTEADGCGVEAPDGQST